VHLSVWMRPVRSPFDARQGQQISVTAGPAHDPAAGLAQLAASLVDDPLDRRGAAAGRLGSPPGGPGSPPTIPTAGRREWHVFCEWADARRSADSRVVKRQTALALPRSRATTMKSLMWPPEKRGPPCPGVFSAQAASTS